MLGSQHANLPRDLSLAVVPVILGPLRATTTLRIMVISWAFWTAAACSNEMNRLQATSLLTRSAPTSTS